MCLLIWKYHVSNLVLFTTIMARPGQHKLSVDNIVGTWRSKFRECHLLFIEVMAFEQFLRILHFNCSEMFFVFFSPNNHFIDFTSVSVQLSAFVQICIGFFFRFCNVDNGLRWKLQLQEPRWSKFYCTDKFCVVICLFQYGITFASLYQDNREASNPSDDRQ